MSKIKRLQQKKRQTKLADYKRLIKNLSNSMRKELPACVTHEQKCEWVLTARRKSCELDRAICVKADQKLTEKAQSVLDEFVAKTTEILGI